MSSTKTARKTKAARSQAVKAPAPGIPEEAVLRGYYRAKSQFKYDGQLLQAGDAWVPGNFPNDPMVKAYLVEFVELEE